MKNILLICMLTFGLVLNWSIVSAEDGFYVIPVKKKNYAPVPKTGQTASFGTGDDGDLQKGVAWPNPRLIDNGNGTVKDNLTGLIWLKIANCPYFFSGDPAGSNEREWTAALTAAVSLGDGYCGLTDGSAPTDWRLPNVKELLSLLAVSNLIPMLPAGHPFMGATYVYIYWSSSATQRAATAAPFFCTFGHVGDPPYYAGCANTDSTPVAGVWPVRGGD